MNLFARPQERPGLQVSRHPISSSTNETFTFIVFSVMRSTTEPSLARIYSDLATKAAAAAIDEELMFTAEKKKICHMLTDGFSRAMLSDSCIILPGLSR
jgi:hypothetical protein